jgi:hypothetical protein
MREDLSRRKALSLLGTALGFVLALTDGEAQTAGTRSRHTKHPKRPTSQLAAPAEAAPAGFKPTTSPSQAESNPPSIGRPPLHPLDEKQQ